MAGSWSFRSTDESGTRRDESQIHNRTDHSPNTAPMSENVDTFGDPLRSKLGLSDLVSPSKRPRLDLPASPPVRPILPIASTSHSEKRATPRRVSPSLHDLPPPGAPRRRTWPPTDPSYSHSGRAFPSYSSYSHSPPAAATFRPSSSQHDSPPPPCLTAACLVPDRPPPTTLLAATPHPGSRSLSLAAQAVDSRLERIELALPNTEPIPANTGTWATGDNCPPKDCLQRGVCCKIALYNRACLPRN